MITLDASKTSEKRSKNGASLGNITGTEASHELRGLQGIDKPKNLIEKVCTETGEILVFEYTKTAERPYKTFQETRAYRYFLKSALSDFLEYPRVLRCSRYLLPAAFGKEPTVQVLKSREHQKCHYAGLQRCGSPWGCPVCAPKISERRKVEVKAAMITAKAMGWGVVLMTCTIPHGIGDDVNQLRANMASAWRRMTTGRAGKAVRQKISLEGTIRAIEVTHGDNGFHPHFHVLLFTSKPVPCSAIQYLFLPSWQDACIKSGLGRPSDERGLDVRNGDQASEYVSKGAFGLEKSFWGLESELTKGQTKLSKSKTGSTPFGLLEKYALTGCDVSKRLFQVYFSAFKGSRQLYWSNGLKAKLAVIDYTDEELLAKEDDECSVLAELTLTQWKAVLSSRCEGALLDIAERDPLSVPAFLLSLQSQPKAKK